MKTLIAEPHSNSDTKQRIFRFSKMVLLFTLYFFILTCLFKIKDAQNKTCSLSEKGGNKMIEKESANRILKLTQNYLIKIYPAFFRTDSSNLNVIDYWIYGFQIGSYIFLMFYCTYDLLFISFFLLDI